MTHQYILRILRARKSLREGLRSAVPYRSLGVSHIGQGCPRCWCGPAILPFAFADQCYIADHVDAGRRRLVSHAAVSSLSCDSQSRLLVQGLAWAVAVQAELSLRNLVPVNRDHGLSFYGRVCSESHWGISVRHASWLPPLRVVCVLGIEYRCSVN